MISGTSTRQRLQQKRQQKSMDEVFPEVLHGDEEFHAVLYMSLLCEKRKIEQFTTDNPKVVLEAEDEENKTRVYGNITEKLSEYEVLLSSKITDQLKFIQRNVADIVYSRSLEDFEDCTKAGSLFVNPSEKKYCNPCVDGVQCVRDAARHACLYQTGCGIEKDPNMRNWRQGCSLNCIPMICYLKDKLLATRNHYKVDPVKFHQFVGLVSSCVERFYSIGPADPPATEEKDEKEDKNEKEEKEEKENVVPECDVPDVK